MNFASVEKIAKAVLYEGYILYPYRPSSTKNRQRWNFGTLYPRDWAELQRPIEPSRMLTECLVQTSPETKLDLRVKFLQFMPSIEGENWEQGVERWADQNADMVRLCEGSVSLNLAFQQTERVEGLRPLSGNLSISAGTLGDGLCKLHLELQNTTSIPNPSESARAQMLLQSMISAHLLLVVNNGEFVSLLDPPAELADAVKSCQNSGAFPVLAGEEGQRSMMLSSPIILYDYPQIAPESVGDYFDGTEMDEMLALRVMTLSEEEKEVMRQGDEHARHILERTETLPAEHWMKVHGAIRGMRRVHEDEAQDKV
ncbi:MAG: hypothetical protein JWO91_2935 [Acidobacteriaceae bacterium]|nr:hypothetical protein [Acidobacteriaceae bacterium]